MSEPVQTDPISHHFFITAISTIGTIFVAAILGFWKLISNLMKKNTEQDQNIVSLTACDSNTTHTIAEMIQWRDDCLVDREKAEEKILDRLDTLNDKLTSYHICVEGRLSKIEAKIEKL